MGRVPPDEKRCVWIKLNDKRCVQPRRDPDAGELCLWHEESLARRQRNWRLAGDLPEMTLEQHLAMELKMSVVQLRELEFQVLDLGLSLDSYRIETEEKETRESEDPRTSYVSVKRAQVLGAHPVILHFLREREHHMKVVESCIRAGFAAKQLAVVERYVDSLIAAQVSLVEALGHDPNEPGIRAAMMESIRAQQAALSDDKLLKELGA